MLTRENTYGDLSAVSKARFASQKEFRSSARSAAQSWLFEHLHPLVEAGACLQGT